MKTAIRCPFHEEKTPSCAVDHEIGRFHCFGCGKTGDLYDLIAGLRAENDRLRKAIAD